MLMMYKRGWRGIYPLIPPPRIASHKTRCVGHRTTRTNRRLGGLSTRGGFGRLSRTLLLFVGRVSHTGLVHRGLHQMARPRLWLSMPGRWRIFGRSYVPREREKRHLGAAHARVRGIRVLCECLAWHRRCSAGFTCKRR
jgi:hypothetical protein